MCVCGSGCGYGSGCIRIDIPHVVLVHAEEQRFLTRLRREKEGFFHLIREKSVIAVPEYFVPTAEEVANTRVGGGAQVCALDDDDDDVVVVVVVVCVCVCVCLAVQP